MNKNFQTASLGSKYTHGKKYIYWKRHGNSACILNFNNYFMEMMLCLSRNSVTLICRLVVWASKSLQSRLQEWAQNLQPSSILACVTHPSTLAWSVELVNPPADTWFSCKRGIELLETSNSWVEKLIMMYNLILNKCMWLCRIGHIACHSDICFTIKQK